MILFKPMSNAVEWSWFKHRTKAIGCEDSQGIVAFDGDKIVAVAVFDTWTADSCQMHFTVADPRVYKKGFLTEIAHHLFDVCSRSRVFGLVASNHPRVLKLYEKMGFKEVARVPHGIKQDIDCVIICLDKEDCRWYKPERAVEKAA